MAENGMMRMITRQEWDEHMEDTKDMKALMRHLECLPIIQEELHNLNKTLLDAALGRDRIPVTILNRMVTIFSAVIVSELFVIIFLITGKHLSFFELLGK